ncbi:hypothetical protein P7C73_g2760, partial [Tremellales sp. Uapishka_1]
MSGSRSKRRKVVVLSDNEDALSADLRVTTQAPSPQHATISPQRSVPSPSSSLSPAPSSQALPPAPAPAAVPRVALTLNPAGTLPPHELADIPAKRSRRSIVKTPALGGEPMSRETSGGSGSSGVRKLTLTFGGGTGAKDGNDGMDQGAVVDRKVPATKAVAKGKGKGKGKGKKPEGKYDYSSDSDLTPPEADGVTAPVVTKQPIGRQKKLTSPEERIVGLATIDQEHGVKGKGKSGKKKKVSEEVPPLEGKEEEREKKVAMKLDRKRKSDEVSKSTKKPRPTPSESAPDLSFFTVGTPALPAGKPRPKTVAKKVEEVGKEGGKIIESTTLLADEIAVMPEAKEKKDLAATRVGKAGNGMKERKDIAAGASQKSKEIGGTIPEAHVEAKEREATPTQVTKGHSGSKRKKNGPSGSGGETIGTEETMGAATSLGGDSKLAEGDGAEGQTGEKERADVEGTEKKGKNATRKENASTPGQTRTPAPLPSSSNPKLSVSSPVVNTADASKPNPKPKPNANANANMDRKKSLPAIKKNKESAAPAPAPRVSAVHQMLALLNNTATPSSTPDKGEKNTPKPIKRGGWSDPWQMTPEQEKEYAASKDQREKEFKERESWKINPVNLQEAKDAYRLDSIQERIIPIDTRSGGRGIMTKGKLSEMIETVMKW